MRATCLLAGTLLVAASAAAFAQQAGAEITSAELHRVRAQTAWVHAAWHVSNEDFERATQELETARKEPGAVPDDWTKFMLATCYARLKRTADCDAVLASVPDKQKYAIFVFVDALRSESAPASGDAAVANAREAIAKFDEYLRQLDAAPPGSPFAPELRFMTYFYRGFTEWRIADYDKAIVDLTTATDLSRRAGRPPATEIVSYLAQAHLSLDQAQEAKRLVAEAMAREPAAAAHYYNFGQILLKEHDDVGARKWFDAALARQPTLVEAHLKLALVGRHTNDPAAMLPHLEAVRAVYDGRARAQAPVDAAAEADLQCGYGLYWKLVGDHRLDEGDDAAAREAYDRARGFLRDALTKEKGCVQAISALIQIASKLGRDDEIPELRQTLEEVQKAQGRRVDPFRSTFC